MEGFLYNAEIPVKLKVPDFSTRDPKTTKEDRYKNIIEDEGSMKSYREVIEKNAGKIKGKVVLDVGCGSGILSLFAAGAGAKMVIAVEADPQIAECTKKVMVVNKKDHIVTVVEGKLEELSQLPNGILQVDVILASFVGPKLFDDRKLMETIVHARDKWLAPGGHIMPDELSLNIFAIQDKRRWDKLLCQSLKISSPARDGKPGFTLNCGAMRKLVRKRVQQVRIKERKHMISTPLELTKIDMNTVSLAQLKNMKLDFHIYPSRNYSTVRCHGLATFFEAKFSKMFGDYDPIMFSNAPWRHGRCWGQSLYLFDQVWEIRQGSSIEGIFHIYQHPTCPADVRVTIGAKYHKSIMKQPAGEGVDRGTFKEITTYLDIC